MTPLKKQIFMDANTMGVMIQTEKYGLFTRFMSVAGQTRYKPREHKTEKETNHSHTTQLNHPSSLPVSRCGNSSAFTHPQGSTDSLENPPA